MVEHCLACLTPSNALACEVMLHTGLRINDVLCLRTDEIKPRFTITEQKTNKRRRVSMPQSLCNRLLAQAGKVYVFEGRNGTETHRTRQAVYNDLKRASKAFRVRENLSPHSLRKIYAVELFGKTGGDLDAVKKALNHDNTTVTMLYALADVLTQRQGLTPKKKSK